MAEFCVDCWNKINETNYSAKKFIISDELDLCEGCGKITNVILMPKEHTSFFYNLNEFIRSYFS